VYDVFVDRYVCKNGHSITGRVTQSQQNVWQQYQQMWQQQQAQAYQQAQKNYYDALRKRYAEMVEEKLNTSWYQCRACGDVFSKAENHFCKEDFPILQLLQLDEDFYMTAQQANVRVWWDVSVSAYRMSSPFNRELVDAIKAFIPVSDRAYDPTSKIWTFVERQLTPLQQLLTKLNCNVVVVTRQQAEQASQSSPNNAVRGKSIEVIALEFMRVAGADAMLKAYRAAAMTLHPDRGGSMDKMSALNAAWDRLQKEVYGQQ